MAESETDTMITLPVLGELTYREWHGFIDGVYCGYVGERDHEYDQEKHYWRIGYLTGQGIRGITDE